MIKKKWQVRIENGKINGEDAFYQFTSFGLHPTFLSKYFDYPIDIETFDKLMFEHRKKSSIAGIKKFNRQRRIFKEKKEI